MQTELGKSGDLSHDSAPSHAHRSPVPALKGLDPAVFAPVSQRSRQAYQGLSSMSVGLELGIAVIIGLVFGMWLDRTLGTTPWLMLVFLGFGFVAGFRGVMRAVRREDRIASEVPHG